MSRAYPSVGVIIPVRNSVRTLASTIESALRQTPVPADLVVVDGGSDDGSAALAASYPRVRVIAQEGLGLAAARNQGLRHVHGDLVAFCDADDTWPDGSLAARLDRLMSEPDCGAVIGQLERVPSVAQSPTVQQASFLGRIQAGYTPGALLAYRSTFEAIGPFDEDLAIGADSDWFVRLVQSNVRLETLAHVVLRKGVRGESLSADVAAYRRDLLRVARGFVDRRRRST